ncbi:4F2 cell-surface antigen heavy chain-like [Sinocyclocheilus rhinocerous]|uniref:4F2 cell-surface antigen heavy chain-like n=1 Tax=Sinocyclocheilus rhinocerous TaxID=307959 RepID=UPI0007B9725A|nr:PREDICTED: 4F2 cell-surface antigen heavy chain-like [Sinocyclocheilus rhinocerous]
MKDVELKEVDQEKQLMTGQTQINGCVKVTVPENAGVKYTGLSKDELIKIASTAGWVRTRWVLLVLFWFGWIGMLAGAIVIIVQAPRCKPIPEMNWWNEGPLYQISDVNAFSEKGLKGVEEKLDYMNQMKVKGLVLGPIHTVQADQLDKLNLVSVKPEVGTKNDLESLLSQAHKKRYLNSAEFNTQMRHHENRLMARLYSTKVSRPKKVALMGSVTGLSVDEVSLVLNRSGVDLLLNGLPDLAEPGERQAQVIKNHYFSHLQMSLGWCLSGRTLGSPAVPVRLYQMLLFTLPGTPVFSAGDEIGLKAGENPKIMWDLEYPVVETNATAKTLQEEHIAVRNFFKTLTHLRGKERSLVHGEYVSLFSSPTSLAFVRLWDQSERFLTAMNWGNDPVTMNLTYRDLPTQAQVRLTTDAANLAVDSMVSLEKFQLGPKQAVLLSYPYAG